MCARVCVFVVVVFVSSHVAKNAYTLVCFVCFAFQKEKTVQATNIVHGTKSIAALSWDVHICSLVNYVHMCVCVCMVSVLVVSIRHLNNASSPFRCSPYFAPCIDAVDGCPIRLVQCLPSRTR